MSLYVAFYSVYRLRFLFRQKTMLLLRHAQISLVVRFSFFYLFIFFVITSLFDRRFVARSSSRLRLFQALSRTRLLSTRDFSFFRNNANHIRYIRIDFSDISNLSRHDVMILNEVISFV